MFKSVFLVFVSALAVRLVIENRTLAEEKEEVDADLVSLADVYGTPFQQYLISFLYGIYLRFTFFNVVIFLVKYATPVYHAYTMVKYVRKSSREWLKQKETELEDIQLKKQIVSTKLLESEFTERADTLRREKERLRRMQARVREVITADETLRRCLEAAAQCDEDLDIHMHVQTPQEENDFMMELLKDLKGDTIAIPDRLYDKLECGVYVTEGGETEPSVYSSVSDVELRQDCRVKIVKVTNVYKVAYLRHYIKQKKMRRATNLALFNKKMENIKKLMEDWQKMLSMVINRTIDVASQEAMGDYSKPLECTCELRGSSDASIDERCLGWALYNEEVPETAVTCDYYSEQAHGTVTYSQESVAQATRLYH